MTTNQNFYPIQNSELIELVLDSTSKSKFTFAESQNIRGRKVKAIEVFTLAMCAISPQGNTLVQESDLVSGSFLTLSIGGKEKIKDLPLTSLMPTNNNGLMRNFDDIEIDLQKSYVTFPVTKAFAAGEVILFNFYYADAEGGNNCK